MCPLSELINGGATNSSETITKRLCTKLLKTMHELNDASLDWTATHKSTAGVFTGPGAEPARQDQSQDEYQDQDHDPKHALRQGTILRNSIRILVRTYVRTATAKYVRTRTYVSAVRT